MATNNFHIENASKVFLIDPQDEFEYENILENIIYTFNEADKEGRFEFSADYQISLETELRSYPSRSIGIVYESLNFLGLDFEVHVIPVIRDGYYEAGNLDYEFAYYVDNTSRPYNSIDDIIYDIQQFPEDYDLNTGLVAIHSNNLRKRLQTLEDTLVNEVEGIFEKVSTEYKVSASFSNGEVWYERA